ncbi:LysR family transcriptional regulator [Vibrio ordalii]|uniref:LysR family transcriptional regulator n=15 Tax=Vibrio TaxID=662 RepID=A0A853QV84_9VIBR|nr:MULTISPECIES: LysR family transcriptional regulator [Vibrio]ASG09658.1 LysR family transcriptional regulator [Vibrio anguillarum]MCS0351356.1 LysR family transcriptional regulator [Vibrio ordalii]MDF9389872.1 LysR family transcriptional regulator [Vibrio sp. 1151_11]NNO00426.1 LysR family transcriptional regulator [Vibrio sp. B1-2]OEE31651.1 LysR family transcriptional regulator [Vibrio ordalii FS-238]
MVAPEINLRSIDLNLLTILEKLLIHKHISQAAQVLNMSQPAVSRALMRLREQFGDPLLVKVKNEYRLTVKGERLYSELEISLNTIRHMLVDDEFDPQQYSGVFTIGALDFEMMMIVPKLLARFQQRAPNLKLQIVSYNSFMPLHDYLEKVADLLLYSTDESPTNVFKQRLFNDNYAVVMCCQHKWALQPMTLERYCQSRHLIISGNGLGKTDMDHELKRLGYQREVVASLPHFSMVPELLINTDLIATLPRRLVSHLGRRYDITVADLPFYTADFRVEQFWHLIHHNSPIHQWVRQEIKNMVDEEIGESV